MSRRLAAAWAKLLGCEPQSLVPPAAVLRCIVNGGVGVWGVWCGRPLGGETSCNVATLLRGSASVTLVVRDRRDAVPACAGRAPHVTSPVAWVVPAYQRRRRSPQRRRQAPGEMGRLGLGSLQFWAVSGPFKRAFSKGGSSTFSIFKKSKS